MLLYVGGDVLFVYIVLLYIVNVEENVLYLVKYFIDFLFIV